MSKETAAPPKALSPEIDALRALETPALVVDRAALERNIAAMAGAAAQAGVALRPHAKTHKSAEIARLQIAAGAVGISCATVTEAEALAADGISGLLITSPTMGAAKLARIAALNRSADVMAVVDHPAQVAGLRAALNGDDRPLRLLIDVDVGQARTGVVSAAAAVDLARTIAGNDRLSFEGIQGFAGQAQHIPDLGERAAAARTVAATLQGVAQALAAAGLPPRLTTGSGTGTYKLDAFGPYDELQVGSYVFMDADYARIREEGGAGLGFAPSLFVLATVISANRPGQVTVDAGTKALATNGPPPCRMVGVPPGAAYAFAGDEHGVIQLPPGAEAPALGARVLIGATHCDPTVNLHSRLNVVKDGRLTIWPILGRYGA